MAAAPGRHLLFTVLGLIFLNSVFAESMEELQNIINKAVSDPPCLHLETRPQGSYESSSVTIQTLHGTKVKSHPGVNLCVLKDGERCFPDNFNAKDGEYTAMQVRMSFAYWGTGVTTPFLPLITPLGDTTEADRNFKVDLAKYEQNYRSISCKSGVCENSVCATGNREGVLNYADIQAGMNRIHRWQLNKDNLKAIDCQYYNEHFPQKAFPDAARVQVKNGSDEYLIGLCLLPPGADCFPKNEKEFEWFKKHMEITRVLSPKVLQNGSQKEDKPLTTTNQSLVLMSWNCESGICNGTSEKCEIGDRSARVWKVYEYNAGSRFNATVLSVIYGVLAPVQYWLTHTN